MPDHNITTLKAAGGKTERLLRAKLTDADAITQGATGSIAAAARAARNLLALDANALMDVRDLLGMIIDQAGTLSNAVNCLAEEAGANWIDKAEREASDRLWAQHHALHKTPGLEASPSE